jgi:hypothetical protein
MNTRFHPIAAALILVASRTVAAEQTPPLANERLADKTLVVWVSPANLTQRGGSAFTIEDAQNHFDGIVFGEIAEGKWMAGSNQFARTEREQSAFPIERAVPGTFVQMAVAYHGREITVYRDGTLYSKHLGKSEPQTFPPNATVLMGKRHRQQGDTAHFGGVIDDARIYDLALSAEELDRLRPNHAGDLKPWAWWTFENDDGTEQTGRFEPAELTRGASIKDGRLVLDGKSGNFLGRSKRGFVIETPVRPANPPADWLKFRTRNARKNSCSDPILRKSLSACSPTIPSGRLYSSRTTPAAWV